MPPIRPQIANIPICPLPIPLRGIGNRLVANVVLSEVRLNICQPLGKPSRSASLSRETQAATLIRSMAAHTHSYVDVWHMMYIRTARGLWCVQAYMVCGRTGRGHGRQRGSVRLEPTPHPRCGYSVYISPLLSEQILSVKIGKNMLKPVSYSLHQGF